MVDATIDGQGSGRQSVRVGIGQTTRAARGAGRFTFGLVGLIALWLKLYEYGVEHEWAFFGDVTKIFTGGGFGDLHVDQWVRVAILILEAGATAAVISIAVTYVVVNNFSNTTNVTNIASSEELGRVVGAIDVNLAELHQKVEAFDAQLRQSQENERARMLEFLKLAESERNVLQAEQLKKDRELLGGIKDALQQVVSAIKE